MKERKKGGFCGNIEPRAWFCRKDLMHFGRCRMNRNLD